MCARFVVGHEGQGHNGECDADELDEGDGFGPNDNTEGNGQEHRQSECGHDWGHTGNGEAIGHDEHRGNKGDANAHAHFKDVWRKDPLIGEKEV